MGPATRLIVHDNSESDTHLESDKLFYVNQNLQRACLKIPPSVVNKWKVVWILRFALIGPGFVCCSLLCTELLASCFTCGLMTCGSNWNRRMRHSSWPLAVDGTWKSKNHLTRSFICSIISFCFPPFLALSLFLFLIYLHRALLSLLWPPVYLTQFGGSSFLDRLPPVLRGRMFGGSPAILNFHAWYSKEGGKDWNKWEK